MYKYETHLHTNICSACAKSTPEEQIAFYHREGYTGIFITEHFIFGNHRFSMDLSWNDYMSNYIRCYDILKREAAKVGMDVFFAVEHAYGDFNEFLVYGLEPEFYLKNTDIPFIPVQEFADRIHAAGGFIVKAHPYRHMSHLPHEVSIELGMLDGIEVYNHHNQEKENTLAAKAAAEFDLYPFSGTDSHRASDINAAKAGIALKRRVTSGMDFISEIRKRDYSLIINGQFVQV